MLFMNEAPAFVVRMASILCVKRPKSVVAIVTDSVRVVEPSYMNGPLGFFAVLKSMGMTPTYYHTEICVKIGNGSKIVFMPLRNEHDMEKMLGYEIDMVAIDHRAMLTQKMIDRAKYMDRRGVTMDTLRELVAQE